MRIRGRAEAREVLTICGVAFGADYHELSSGTVDRLLEWADRWRYRKPRNANGSRGRYFHAMLQRRAMDRSYQGFVLATLLKG